MRNHVKCVNYGAWNPFNKFLYSSCSLPGIKLGNWAQRKASLGVFFLTVNLKRFLFVIGCFFPRTFICFFSFFVICFLPECISGVDSWWSFDSDWFTLIKHSVLASHCIYYCMLQILVLENFTAQYLFSSE